MTYSVNFSFELGARVKDRVSGMQGIIIARVEYLNGCRQYCVKPKSKENKDGHYIDEQQLELTDKQPKDVLRPAEIVGGPGTTEIAQQETPHGR